MTLTELVETSIRIAQTSRRLEKIDLLGGLLRRLAPEEIPVAVHYLSGSLRQGRIGIGYAAFRQFLAAPAVDSPRLSMLAVDEAFERIAAIAGSGSSRSRLSVLDDLLRRATRQEKDFLFRLVLGELRQGSLEGIMAESIARAASLPAGMVRRAVMVSGSLAEVGKVALSEGGSGLERFGIRIFSPVQPMLAQTAADTGEALQELGDAALEYKMDGARIQAHKSGSEVHIFSRALNELTPAIPEVVDALLRVRNREIILDGEAIALREDGRPHAFQTTMRRFGRKLNVSELRDRLPVTAFFFDCLYVDGEALIDHSTEERFSVLRDALPEGSLIPRTVTNSPETAANFALEALRAGHEGLMAKALDAPYEAGTRGKTWLKVKHAHTLDLVVLAAEWGHGRRRGRLSNLHLGARDAQSGQFVMLGKTFKGMTDEMLEWQTAKLLELEVSRDDWTVYVRPALVTEIAVNDIQVSPHYPAGLALRFARVKRYRPDKTPEQADTIDTVRAIHGVGGGK
jgi:DNA ligase-1